MARRHRFRPRYHKVAWTAAGMGGVLAAVAASVGALGLPLVTGAAGVVLGAAYLLSPAWRLAVTVDDGGLEVGSPGQPRFRLAWSEVVRVVAAPAVHSCFVDGGTAQRSLLVPGPGAPAPYDLEDRPGLVAAILAHVPKERVTLVETLEGADVEPRPAPPADGP
jgi:hypothetical protein